MNNPAPQSNAAPRIAVIGGGISGLAAAHRLTYVLPRTQVSLFEASGRFGGILETVERDGFLIERSADNFLSQDPAAVNLCRQLGIADELLPTDEAHRRALVLNRGRLLPVPAGFYLMSPRKLWPILKTPILSVAGKLRLLAEPLVPPWRTVRAEAGQGASDSGDESVSSFATRRLGRETFERLVQPLVAGIYTADSSKLSMAATMPQFLACERNHGSLLLSTLGSVPSAADTDSTSGARYGLFLAPKSGLSSLINALVGAMPKESLHLNSPVSQITRTTDSRWQLKLTESTNSPSTYDALILAVPAHAAARLIEPTDAILAAELAQIEYAGCVVVSMGFLRRQIARPLDSFGFVVPQIENRPIIAASFASNKFPGRAPADAILIRTFIGGAMRPELLELSDDELRRIALGELSALLQISGDPIVADIARWPLTMPQYHVGHLARVSRIESTTARHANLALAGNAYHGVGIPQCITSGEQAADQITRCFV